ncbi:MAG: bifunctional oligoribonuclease/PAP phosphatase NrnA [Bacillota bacterium]
MRDELKFIADAIFAAQKIVLFTHISLDGDSLGSSGALALVLENMKKEVFILTETSVPGALEFLPVQHLIVTELPEGFVPELSIALDCGDRERFADREKIFDSASVTANIDHHRTNIGYAQLNCVDKNKSSTSELVYEMIKDMNVEITKDVAKCIYVGLATDTGGFRHANTNSDTHLCASELLKYGLNIAPLSQDIFVYSSESMIKLQARALASLELYYDKKLAIVTVTQQDFEECGAARSETEGFADFGRALPSVLASVSMREFEKNKIKISMRSKGLYNVAKIAQIFGGGGHINAAGCSIDDTFENAKAKIIKAFEAI